MGLQTVQDNRKFDDFIQQLLDKNSALEARIAQLEGNEGTGPGIGTVWIINNISQGPGDHISGDVSATFTNRTTLVIPDDYASLVSLEWVVSPSVSGTVQYDINTDYGNPDNNEAYNFHSETINNASFVGVANRFHLLSAAAAVTSLLAGDILGLALTFDSNTGGGTLRMFGVRLIYNRG